MTKKPAPNPAKKPFFAARAVGSFVPGLTRKAFEKFGFSAATLTAGDQNGGLWSRLGAVIPLLALVAGLLTIAVVQEKQRASEIADVDVELLADDLPPDAYTDPGFAHFLSINKRD